MRVSYQAAVEIRHWEFKEPKKEEGSSCHQILLWCQIVVPSVLKSNHQRTNFRTTLLLF